MKNRVCCVCAAIVVLLASFTGFAQALTIGELRGAAVLGRSLDVTVQLQRGAGEDVSAACLSAEVFHADARQLAPRVSVRESTSGEASSLMRIQSSVVIDEPVVAVVVRSTCGASASRRYVLLADFPQQAVVDLPSGAAQALALPGGQRGVGADAPPVLVLSNEASKVKPMVPGSAPLATLSTRLETPAKVKKTTVKPTSTPTPRSPVMRSAGKSVLKLDPLDILSDRIDALDATMVFAPTEDALRYTHQISAMEGDLKTLRERVASNDSKLTDLRTQLQEAQASLIPMWVIYLLALLLAGSLAALAWLWQRQRQQNEAAQQAWWADSPMSDAGNVELTSPSDQAHEQETAFAPSTILTTSPVDITKPAVSEPDGMPSVLNADLDIDLSKMVPQAFDHGSFEVSSASMPFELNSVRHISVEPILDIRQQAEFFVSLGQNDRALQILKKQIASSAEPNPLVYLDLIALYHSMGLKLDFRERRDAFHKLFNGLIPDFPAFSLEGKDLESYPDVLAELTKRWPHLEALAFLSACIFKEEYAPVPVTFDLAAFRDLLMLHALAEEVVDDHPVTVTLVPPPATVPLAAVADALPLPEVAAAAAPPVRLNSVSGPLSEPVEDFPSRMLDLDFSNLSAFAPVEKKAADNAGSDASLKERLKSRENWLADKKPK